MDSVTQIILGAACGELVAGKKIGNRALIWGGIGGTIPDLDVFANLFMDPLTAMTFHRGPMHSLVFASIMPLLLGPLVKRLYDLDWHSKQSWKWIGFSIGLLLYSLCVAFITMVSSMMTNGFPWLILTVFAGFGLFFFVKRFQQLKSKNDRVPNMAVKHWILLLFFSIFTHPLLDAMTTYGTMLFWPFSDYRVSISSISIVDPLYSIPFALSLLAAALFNRTQAIRNRLVWIGMAYSCLYLGFSLLNKNLINDRFEESLKREQVSYNEFITVPTIFNNLLWYGAAKTDAGYVCGYYSWLDNEKLFGPLTRIDGRHDVFNPYTSQEITKLLPWFSDGYYSLHRVDSATILYNDLRFGSMGGKLDDPNEFIFKFKIEEKDGQLEMVDDERPENDKEDVKWFKNRIAGKK